MALKFGDGFDHYTAAQVTQKWDSLTDATLFDIDAAYGRLGSKGFTTNAPGLSRGHSYSLVKNLTASNSGFGFLGVAIYVPSYQMGGFRRNIFSLFDTAGGGFTSNSQIHLCLEQDGSFTLRYATGAGSHSAALATSLPGQVPAATWVYVELKVKCSSASGEAYVKVNGATVLSATGIDTANMSANNYFTSIGVGGSEGTSGAGAITYFDDFYYCDDTGAVNNGFLGDVQIQAIYPEADTATADWTPSNAGDNYVEVDDATPDDDSGYVSSNTPGDDDLYEMQDISSTATTIFGLLCNARVKKDDATVRAYALLVESGGTVGELATRTAPFGSYVNQQDVSETNPDTTAQWTKSEVDAMTAGIRVKS
jgi:hypothetical protein